MHGHKELLFKPFTPYIDPAFKDTLIFDVIKERDVAMQHPYDSFEPVVDFSWEAAEDPQV